MQCICSDPHPFQSGWEDLPAHAHANSTPFKWNIITLDGIQRRANRTAEYGILWKKLQMFNLEKSSRVKEELELCSVISSVGEVLLPHVCPQASQYTHT